eukprot:3404422-Rhodomonas_salina.3
MPLSVLACIRPYFAKPSTRAVSSTGERRRRLTKVGHALNCWYEVRGAYLRSDIKLRVGAYVTDLSISGWCCGCAPGGTIRTYLSSLFRTIRPYLSSMRICTKTNVDAWIEVPDIAQQARRPIAPHLFTASLLLPTAVAPSRATAYVNTGDRLAMPYRHARPVQSL